MPSMIEDITSEKVADLIGNLANQTDVVQPVYVISRHRSQYELVSRQLIDGGVPHHLVIEPHDYDAYASRYPSDVLLTTPVDNIGLAGVRNFCKDHSTQNGHRWHWCLDDNIKGFDRLTDGKRQRVPVRNVLSVVEQTVSWFDGIGAATPCNTMWMFAQAGKPPITYNRTISCAMLLNNTTSARFRSGMPVDADYTLQMLAAGWSTVVITHLGYHKTDTGKMQGGLTETEYQGDGRDRRMETLIETWPNVYKMKRTADGRPRLGPPNLRRYQQRPTPTPAFGPIT
jgi:hypothetical protein